jgi:hypothetical protein
MRLSLDECLRRLWTEPHLLLILLSFCTIKSELYRFLPAFISLFLLEQKIHEIYSLTKLSFVKTRKAFARNLSDQHCCLVLWFIRFLRQDLKRKLCGFLSSRFIIIWKYVFGCNYNQLGRGQCRRSKNFVISIIIKSILLN